MRVQLRFPVPCSPAAAWDVITSPAQLARTYAPVLTLHAEDPIPDRLDVSARLLTPLVWLALWGMWQLRAVRLRRTMRRS